MKKVNKVLKKGNKLVVNNDVKSKTKIMSSNLPLLFANGKPRSLDTISQPELEDFVPFMIMCSLGREFNWNPKDVNNCPVPEWWPQGFPFKFPLVEQSDYINRHVMLKSLVCRCYTFYDCEFLLKFSSELAEMPPSHLKFESNKEENTTSIFDERGNMLVKCRNENIQYDMHKNRRRYLSPTHRPTLTSQKRFEPVIDLTFDTSSEDEKEVYFKEQNPVPKKVTKRKASSDVTEESSAKQKISRRMFFDFPEEQPEPLVYDQENFMKKFDLVPLGKEIVKEELKVVRRKRLAKAFTVLSVSSKRGQQVLEKSKHSFNLEACLERLDRITGPNSQDEVDSNQISTRASGVWCKAIQGDAVEAEVQEVDRNVKWYHNYKWPHRTSNVIYNHRGPSLKPCTVNLQLLSNKEIQFLMKKKRTVATNTPEHWQGSETLICDCQKIPLIELDDESPPRYQDKSSSTRCTCSKVKVQSVLHKAKQEPLLSIYQSLQIKPEALVKPRLRPTSESVNHDRVIMDVPSIDYTRSPIHSYSNDKGGSTSVLHNYLHQSQMPLDYKKTINRKPLAVVSPTAVDIEVPDVVCKSMTGLHQETSLTLNAKISFYKSIVDAVKWYTKEDSIVDLCGENLKEENVICHFERSQENIKPLAKPTLPKYLKPIDYFENNLNKSGHDYCFERSSNESTNLVTRRGGRHYVNREPCPSCFQGNDNFCVYEFIRQAKLAGVSLNKNQKQLQIMFLNFIQKSLQ